jgi:hypothetical protein
LKKWFDEKKWMDEPRSSGGDAWEIWCIEQKRASDAKSLATRRKNQVAKKLAAIAKKIEDLKEEMKVAEDAVQAARVLARWRASRRRADEVVWRRRLVRSGLDCGGRIDYNDI